MPETDKDALRVEVRKLKMLLTPAEKELKSVKIFDTIEQMHQFKHAKIIAAYWSMPDEVETHQFIVKWYQRKTILLPVVAGNDINFCIFKDVNDMQPGSLKGTLEPLGEIFTELHKIQLIIVPGIAFDVNNNRLGRGKGYYDRILKLTKAFKIGVAFDFQHFEKVPVNANDVKMDQVIFG